MSVLTRKTGLHVPLAGVLVVIVAVALLASDVHAGPKNSLKQETMMHPLDSFSAYTFDQGEWSWNIPLSLPVGWLWWGVTDWLSVEIDTEALLGGVPSLNARFGLRDQRGPIPAIAYETMYQFLHKEYDLLEGYEFLEVVRKGSSWYHRINASWELSQGLHLHASVGATYSQELRLANKNRMQSHSGTFEHLLAPDVSVAIDHRLFDWMSAHVAASYGSTFTYLDNVPRKIQLASGVRVAPFANTEIWGLRNLRAELSFLAIYFDDAKEFLAGPVPYVYWQWGGR